MHIFFSDLDGLQMIVKTEKTRLALTRVVSDLDLTFSKDTAEAVDIIQY